MHRGCQVIVYFFNLQTPSGIFIQFILRYVNNIDAYWVMCLTAILRRQSRRKSANCEATDGIQTQTTANTTIAGIVTRADQDTQTHGHRTESRQRYTSKAFDGLRVKTRQLLNVALIYSREERENTQRDETLRNDIITGKGLHRVEPFTCFSIIAIMFSANDLTCRELG